MASRILVTHYDPRKRRHIRELLERWGFQVLEAVDGPSAIEQAQQARPDLILLYAPLPRLNAPEACQQIRQLPGFQATPVVIFSDVYRGHQVRSTILRRFGATDLIEWPIAENVFRQKIQTWLGGSVPPTVAVARPTAQVGPAPEMEEELQTLLAPSEAPSKVPTPETVRGPVPEVLAAPPEVFQQELQTLLAQLEVPSKAPAPETARGPVPEAPVAEAPPTVPAVPQEVFQEVIAEVEETITDLAAEETVVLTGTPGVPVAAPPAAEGMPAAAPPAAEGVDERQVEQEVLRILQETLSGIQVSPPPPEAPAVPMEKPAPSPSREAEGMPFGPYVLLKRVATGGMAELFVAKKRGVEGFEKTLAIKRILPHLSDNKEFINMFIDEARVVARLTHPNIVQIFDMGRIDGDYYIAMEYVSGKDLRAVLRRAQEVQRPVPIEIAVIVAIHLCAALDYAHRARDDQGRPLHIVHRDVSPPNVLISYDGDIKLTDFGIAKVAVKLHVTLSGALKGKVLYMAPEQANLQSIDARSDIYSLGLVLYEMLAGRNPFYESGDTEITVLEKVRQGRVPPVRTFRPDVPEPLVRVLEKALQPDPARRYPSAREFQQDLEDFLVQRGIPNSTLYVARFIRELFPEEAGPVDEIQEKLRHLPRIVPRTPPAAVEAPSEAAPTVLGETPVLPSLPVSVEAVQPTGAVARSFKERVTYLTRTPKRRQPTVLLLFVGLFIILAGAIMGIVLHQASVRRPPTASVASASPQLASSEPTRLETPPAPEPAPAVNSQRQGSPPPMVSRAPTETKAPASPTPPAKAPEGPTSPVKVPEVLPPTPPVKAPAQETGQPAKGTPPAPPPTPEAPPSGVPTETKAPAPPPTPEAPPSGVPTETKAPAPPPTPEAPPSGVPTETKAPAPPAEMPHVRPGDLVESPDEPPVPLRRVQPDFPALARAQRLSDTVILRVLVDERGNVTDVQVLRYKYAILRDAALEAVRKYTFRPARHQGVPVKTWYTVPVIFQP